MAGLPPPAALALGTRRRLIASQVLAHLAGGIDVAVLLFVVLPRPETLADRTGVLVVASVALAVAGLVFGSFVGDRIAKRTMGWLQADRVPDEAERTAVLALPNRVFKLNALAWLLAATGLFVLNIGTSAELAVHVAVTVVLGGLSTCGIAHLLLERDLRPVTDLALASGPPDRRAWPGIQGRVVLAWLLATGSPVLGIVLVGAGYLVESDQDPNQTAVAVVILGTLALVVGLGTIAIATRTVTRPLAAVRAALARVEGGDLSADVTVDDGSEVGLLQSGFNSMVGGLRERERLRGLYDRQVGADVAAAALADEPVLGGETRDVAVLFVDIIASTTLAQRTPPEHVVARLNAFFTVVVETVAETGGWVNKFEGDAALCVWGAPQRHRDAPGAALAAGRALRQRLLREVPDLDAGIGIACGEAVAGWVGARERYEYTVIGDPVNVAARLSELAKGRPERTVATASLLEHCHSPAERLAWLPMRAQRLRGRDEPTRLATPASAVPASRRVSAGI